jgi:flagellar motility protein MotE (MotC chaperone)
VSNDVKPNFLSASLPTTEELPAGDGYEKEAVEEAFTVFRHHLLRLSAHLRVLDSARVPGQFETAHPLRMDALALVRAALEAADGVERDALEKACHAIERARGEVVVARQEAKDAFKDELQDVEQKAQKLLDDARDEAQRLIAETRGEVVTSLEWARSQARLIVDRAEQAAQQLLVSGGLPPAEVEPLLAHLRPSAAGEDLGAGPARDRL